MPAEWPKMVLRTIYAMLQRTPCWFRRWVRALRAWRAPRVVRRVVWDELSYSGARTLAELHEAVRQAEAERRPGILIEAGCALGGSALVIASAKQRGRVLEIYD